MEKQQTKTRFYTIRQVSEMLGITPETILKRCATGILPAYRFGGSVRISVDDFEDYIQASRKTSRKEVAR